MSMSSFFLIIKPGIRFKNACDDDPNGPFQRRGGAQSQTKDCAIARGN